MGRPRLLDAFCGGGGAGMGYHLAGFDVLGVDHAPQPHYPFEAIRADALEYVASFGHLFDVIHASPPCQRYSRTRSIHDSGGRHPDLIAPTRQALLASGKPWVIENVTGAPLSPFSLTLCGLMFGLRVVRHRLFECSHLLWAPPHPRHNGRAGYTQKRGSYDRGERGLVTVAGNNFCPAVARLAMGIDWMTGKELAQAIPPAYTRWIGERLLASLDTRGG